MCEPEGRGPPDGQPRFASFRVSDARKVRSPQGSVPANGRGGSLKADFTESATENIPPAWSSQGQCAGKGEMVR